MQGDYIRQFCSGLPLIHKCRPTAKPQRQQPNRTPCSNSAHLGQAVAVDEQEVGGQGQGRCSIFHCLHGSLRDREETDDVERS